jgi:dienelactone hydrolase
MTSLARSLFSFGLGLACVSQVPFAAAQTPAATAKAVTQTSAAPAPLPRIDSALFAKEPFVLSNGIRGVPVTVPTSNPVDYAPLIKGELGKSVDITGQLFMPAGAARPVAAVIENPGSGSLGPHHLAHAAALTSAGMAVLVIDPFFARSIDNTMVDQYGQISWATTSYDVLAAVRFLRARSDIDGTRIGATGGSRGGTAVMMAAAAPLSDAVLGAGKGLRAVVAGYPWCGTQFHSARLAKGTALLVMSGDKDDWVSFLQCQDATHAMQVAGGQNVLMKLFPGAHHAFDREGVPPTLIPAAVTSTVFPTVYMDDKGSYYNMRTDEVDPSLTAGDFLNYSIKGGFLHKGVTVGAEGTEAAEYSREMTEFFKAKLR